MSSANVFISVGMFPIGECIFCYKGPRKSYVSMTSNEASVFHLDERYMGESDGKENRMRSIENHCVRHSAGSYPSGEISQTDVHSHTRSNKGHRMYCFGELRTHHTSILASTSSYRQPRFAPHSIRKGHLERTHTRTRTEKQTSTRTHAKQREGRKLERIPQKGFSLILKMFSWKCRCEFDVVEKHWKLRSKVTSKHHSENHIASREWGRWAIQQQKQSYMTMGLTEQNHTGSTKNFSLQYVCSRWGEVKFFFSH